MPGRIRRRDDVSPLAAKREKRLSFAESVQWVGEWDALSVVDLMQRNKTGQASCRERICRRDDVSPLAVKREKRLSFGESVHCAGESVAGMGECSPLAGALTVILPAHPASGGTAAGARHGSLVGRDIFPACALRGGEHLVGMESPSCATGAGPFGTEVSL